ncbi:hypothetical protein LV89_03820 [Arcicella aurantiaca]|uniref:Uncharacterized protein n=1 Tax=Arcicella aurantiaca TaxID=591202 RepID=A0A316DS22_9BACT|nr:hypothetical protein [Arcicella aurantiaca]PWK20278.1 hypothetical protein LV89_03820 [Arcicella aurantiaca]
MAIIDVKSAIKSLNQADRALVGRAFYKHFPKASESRFKNVIGQQSMEFDAIERNALAKHLIEVDENGKVMLDCSDEFMEFIGETV